jgi:hypothetical protein
MDDCGLGLMPRKLLMPARSCLRKIDFPFPLFDKHSCFTPASTQTNTYLWLNIAVHLSCNNPRMTAFGRLVRFNGQDYCPFLFPDWLSSQRLVVLP